MSLNPTTLQKREEEYGKAILAYIHGVISRNELNIIKKDYELNHVSH